MQRTCRGAPLLNEHRARAIPRRRWRIATLLGVGVLINYFDRVNLSVAAPDLSAEFGLTPADIGLLLSAYAWSYAVLQIPAGMILDRFGVTLVGRVGALLWAVASGLTALAGGIVGIFAARLALGVAEAPSFPGNAKATGYWFPRQERARARGTRRDPVWRSVAGHVGVPFAVRGHLRLRTLPAAGYSP